MPTNISVLLVHLYISEWRWNILLFSAAICYFFFQGQNNPADILCGALVPCLSPQNRRWGISSPDDSSGSQFSCPTILRRETSSRHSTKYISLLTNSRYLATLHRLHTCLSKAQEPGLRMARGTATREGWIDFRSYFLRQKDIIANYL